jgi:hypothetical protein
MPDPARPGSDQLDLDDRRLDAAFCYRAAEFFLLPGDTPDRFLETRLARALDTHAEVS